MLENREEIESQRYYSTIFDAQYNDFVPPNEKARNFILESKSDFLRKLYFAKLHLGQYITHGVFEMDHMIANSPPVTYGKFNSYILVKGANKLGLSEIELNELENPTGRITYLTFFGGLYIDFRWYALIIMFTLGYVQRKVFELSEYHYLWKPLIVLFCFSNFFLLTFNFIRAQFLLSICVYLLLLFLMLIIFKSKRFFKLN